jgi:hypothetical protein
VLCGRKQNHYLLDEEAPAMILHASEQEMVWRQGLLIALFELMALIMIGYVGMVIQFFRRGAISYGLICTFCLVCPPAVFFGVLFVLLFGWLQAGRWQLRAFMGLWTGLVLLAVLNVAAIVILRSLDVGTRWWLFGPEGPLGSE